MTSLVFFSAKKGVSLGVSLVWEEHTRLLCEHCDVRYGFELKSLSPADENSMVETQRPGQSQVAKKFKLRFCNF